MSYPIIFETKIIKLKDGRLLHCSLQGCNNDTEGRTRGEFQPTIYTLDEFKKRIADFKKDSSPIKKSNGFDLKIGSRLANFYDYGTHLERMLKKAMTLEELKKERCFYVIVLDSIEEKESRIHFNTHEINTEDEIVKAIEENKHLRAFYIGKKYKKRKFL